jgi:hypothetical protein
MIHRRGAENAEMIGRPFVFPFYRGKRKNNLSVSSEAGGDTTVSIEKGAEARENCTDQ